MQLQPEHWGWLYVVGGIAAFVLSFPIAAWIDRRAEALSEAREYDDFVSALPDPTPAPLANDNTDTWIRLGDTDIVRAAAVLKRETTPPPQQQAAE